MSEYSHSEKEFVKEQYEQMLKEHQQNETVLVSHYGELSQSVISNLEGNVEEKITSLDIAKGPIKRFSLLALKLCKICYCMVKKINKENNTTFLS